MPMLPSLALVRGVRQQAVTVSVVPHLDAGAVIRQELVELLLQLDGETVPAGEDALQAAQIGALHTGQAQQRLIQRGHARDQVAAVLDHVLGVGLGGELGDQDAVAAMVCTQTPRPKPWNSGMAASILSPGVKMGLAATTCWPRALKFRFVSTMPLVVPVVPPE